MEVITLGETMASFFPNQGSNIQHASYYNKATAGAESNVAIGLARLGHKVGWISRLGADPYGRYIFQTLRGEGVDVSQVQWDEVAPTGIFFRESTGLGKQVIYYRRGSAASMLSPVDLSEEYFKKAKLLHLTGITPALSTSCRETAAKAIELAKRNKLIISFDPNIRLKLWDINEAKPVLLPMMQQSDIVLIGDEEGKLLFGTNEPTELVKEVAALGPKIVVVKLGHLGAYWWTEGQQGLVGPFDVKQVVDTIGAGDGFAAGFLAGYLEQLPIEAAVSRGNKVGALVTTAQNDTDGLPFRSEIEKLEKQEAVVER
ncbi:MAG: sugar kinase [Bacillota bacterium]|nr:sugar kinase [Bacillota bacterium]